MTNTAVGNLHAGGRAGLRCPAVLFPCWSCPSLLMRLRPICYIRWSVNFDSTVFSPAYGGRRNPLVQPKPSSKLTLLHECEAITCRQRLGFAVLALQERVVAGVDSGAAVHAGQWLAEGHLETGQDLERRDEVAVQRGSIRSHGRRERSPEHPISGIEKHHCVRIVLAQTLGPFHGRGGNVLFRPGRDASAL